MKYLSCCLIWCFALSLGMGQNPAQSAGKKEQDPQDLVILKSGKKIWGQIQTYEIGQNLVILTEEGMLMKIPAAVLNKFTTSAQSFRLKHQLKEEEPFLEKGHLYNNFALFFPFGAEIRGESRSGWGFEHSFGLQLSPRVGVGITTGMNFMFGGVSDRIVPLAAEVRLYNKPERRNRYYVLLDSGYGMGWAADNLNEAYTLKGGWRVHPGLGAVWSKKGNTHISTELGFWHQRASLIEEWEGWRRENSYKMNRWSFKIGLMF